MFNDINWQDVAVGFGLSIAVALALAQLSARGVRLVLATATGDTGPHSFRDPIHRRPIRIVRGLVFIASLVLVTTPILELLGVELSYGIRLDRLTTWLLQQGPRVILIALLAYFAVRVTALSVTHFEEVVKQRTGDDIDKMEFSERLHTIGGLVKNAVNILVIGATVLMILQELGVDITPLLTGAGIAGLAVGFGAQNLVRDVISGFFLILEDQVHVGDVVEVNGTAGLVESVKLRTIVLRDLSGTVHVIPNGSITTLSNKTKKFSYAVLDIGVAYKEDTDHVSEVLRQVGADLRADPTFNAHILANLEILGVDEFADSAVIIKIRIKTRPLKQWMIGRELRRRIKKAFDAQGIEIPFPHMSLYYGEASRPFLTHEADLEELESSSRPEEKLNITPPPPRERPTAATETDGDDGGYE